MEILLATQNEHKIIEFQNKLKGTGIIIKSLVDFNDDSDCIENGKTFEENALIKAKTYYNKYHLPTISDDSGLVVKALNGAPGIYSKRYSGGNDQDNINLLLKKLKNEKDRSAFFECAICYYDGDAHYFIGKCHGDIGFIPEGDDGFGYDPIFLYNGKSFAQISLDEKNKISHRARAINEFVKYIKEKNNF